MGFDGSEIGAMGNHRGSLTWLSKVLQVCPTSLRHPEELSQCHFVPITRCGRMEQKRYINRGLVQILYIIYMRYIVYIYICVCVLYMVYWCWLTISSLDWTTLDNLQDRLSLKIAAWAEVGLQIKALRCRVKFVADAQSPVSNIFTWLIWICTHLTPKLQTRLSTGTESKKIKNAQN